MSKKMDSLPSGWDIGMDIAAGLMRGIFRGVSDKRDQRGKMPVVSPYKSELRELARAVITPLKSGLHSFNNVLDMLLSVNADIVDAKCQTFRDIRQEIVNMKQQMKKAAHVAEIKVKHLDGETERLTAEQSNLANQKQQRERELKKIKRELKGHKSVLETNRNALGTARSSLRSAEDTLAIQREKIETAQTIRNVGIGVMAIPIVGWIAGGVMVGVGQTDLNWASDAVDGAKEEVEDSESQVRLYSDKVSEYSSLIDKAKCDIKKADNKIHETEAKLQGVSVQREVVADVQAKVRRAVHQLGLLSGVGNVAELQTQRQILLEPVIKVMEDMTTALGKIAGDDLLHTEGIKSLMLDMKKNQRKLKQLPDTKDTGEDNEYY